MAARALALPREQESKEATRAPISLEGQRAYAIYLQRGGRDGSELDDRLRAEEELRKAAEPDYRTDTNHWPVLERG